MLPCKGFLRKAGRLPVLTFIKSVLQSLCFALIKALLVTNLLEHTLG